MGDTGDTAMNSRNNMTHTHTLAITCSKSHQSTSNQHVVFVMSSWHVDICI